ncbi:delta(3,5)-Delta(2,4)-dienoyl-CoA isomerase, mitochondrial-like [Saccoglossus kowalevskii]|uniref:Delta(3,5)-Delta(2,4)-dienoyl-CoA isomerase, mitochondrial-like n=1 Tax=Saccoglossus kowalevskii TaxID=10224 RepID=A0ABM0GIT6_SACKO|nr:PREDICTED: delta(3,5)-Delta(2,4)-dienoyl-CoA isomerase, mitochondrial-like [Saccoglossus kowalevskii]
MSLIARSLLRTGLFAAPRAIKLTQVLCSARKMSSNSLPQFETLAVTSPKEYVYQVELNRPKKLNAMNKAFWREMVECFNGIAQDPNCRIVILTGAGRAFTSGLDVMDHADVLMSMDGEDDVSRKAFKFIQFIKKYQETFTVIEKCRKPVIAAIHNACVGGGVDMITACDIRLCTEDAWFQIKEVELGLAADVGTLQRLPKIVGNDSLVRELAYTARRFQALEAKGCGLVSQVYKDKDTMIEGALELASTIASQSPIAVQGTKVNLIYSRDHSVPEALDYIAAWNMSMLQTEDLMKAIQAGMAKEKANFSKL